MSRQRTPDGQLSFELGDTELFENAVGEKEQRAEEQRAEDQRAAGQSVTRTQGDSSPSVAAALADIDQLEALLLLWREAGWIRPLDVAFARTLRELSQEQGDRPSPLVILLAALASHQVGRGHVCIELPALLSDARTALALPPDDEPYSMAAHDQPRIKPADILSRVSLSDCAAALTRSIAIGDGTRSTPLVLDGTRLYLRRYWLYEQQVARSIQTHLQEATAVADASAPPAQLLAKALDILFPPSKETDYQKLACALAARTRFGVITGGPGTGKTTTVVKLLAALQAVAGESAERQGRKYRIRLAAPTGKAAARLNESIGGAVHRLPLRDLPGNVSADDIPVQVSTLHRLLGSRPHSRFFRHHRDNPLPLDILVIDEASMVDLEMMAAVFDALPAQAQIILLGDKDQLASVDAGAVLGDLCRQAQQGHYLPGTAEWLHAVTGSAVPPDLVGPEGHALDQAVAMLRRTYRFETGSGIQQLADAVNAGRLDNDLVARCRQPAFADVAWFDVPRSGSESAAADEQAIKHLCRHATTGSPQEFLHAGVGRQVNGQLLSPPAGYGHYLHLMQQHGLTADSPREAWDELARSVLTAFGEFQLLCALRKGPWGVEALNERIAQHLVAQGLLPRAEGWYAGRPVLITGNDYNLGLMNGDIGITFSLPWGRVGADGRKEELLRVAFPSNDGSQSIRWLSPSRLQRLETVFAMTVHKSQGSEFTHTCLVLPAHASPILTRELLYTGITRAKSWFSLMVGSPVVLNACVSQRVSRVSALSDRIREHRRARH